MDSRQAPRLKKIEYSITLKLNSNSGMIGNAAVDNTTATVIKHFVFFCISLNEKLLLENFLLAFLSLQGKEIIWCLVFKLVFTCTCLSLSFPFFWNVSHYSIRKEILLNLVPFCPPMSITKIFHLFNFHCFWWPFCLIAMKHIKNFIHSHGHEVTLFYQA